MCGVYWRATVFGVRANLRAGCGGDKSRNPLARYSRERSARPLRHGGPICGLLALGAGVESSWAAACAAVHHTDPAVPLCSALLQAGVAVRSGHMCTQPIHRHLGVSSSIRAAPYFYNTTAEVGGRLGSPRRFAAPSRCRLCLPAALLRKQPSSRSARTPGLLLLLPACTRRLTPSSTR